MWSLWVPSSSGYSVTPALAQAPAQQQWCHAVPRVPQAFWQWAWQDWTSSRPTAHPQPIPSPLIFHFNILNFCLVLIINRSKQKTTFINLGWIRSYCAFYLIPAYLWGQILMMFMSLLWFMSPFTLFIFPPSYWGECMSGWLGVWQLVKVNKLNLSCCQWTVGDVCCHKHKLPRIPGSLEPQHFWDSWNTGKCLGILLMTGHKSF